MRKFSKSTFFCELDIKLNNENRHSSNFSFLRLLSCALFHVSSGKLFFLLVATEASQLKEVKEMKKSFVFLAAVCKTIDIFLSFHHLQRKKKVKVERKKKLKNEGAYKAMRISFVFKCWQIRTATMAKEECEKRKNEKIREWWDF